MLHSCYDCGWECLDGCCMQLDYNGDREPVYDEPTDCPDFIPKEVLENE